LSLWGKGLSRLYELGKKIELVYKWELNEQVSHFLVSLLNLVEQNKRFVVAPEPTVPDTPLLKDTDTATRDTPQRQDDDESSSGSSSSCTSSDNDSRNLRIKNGALSELSEDVVPRTKNASSSDSRVRTKNGVAMELDSSDNESDNERTTRVTMKAAGLVPSKSLL
jgi:hypothetical protein